MKHFYVTLPAATQQTSGYILNSVDFFQFYITNLWALILQFLRQLKSYPDRYSSEPPPKTE